MRNNLGQPSTPSGLFSARLRLCSINSPFISPLRIIPSPFINDGNFLDQHQANNQLNQFQLEEQGPAEKTKQQIVNNQIDEQSEIQLPVENEEQEQQVMLDENNMLGFILRNINKNQRKIQLAREGLEGYGTQFNKKLFDHLINKFKKLRKTKQQMVKYCVRKSFKHITIKMRAANKEAYINMENNEVVAEYFEQNCNGDISISMPFKKQSEEKTMNLNFLKKIFKCRQYYIDYKQFLRLFPQQYNSDNKKKIKSLNQVIKKCVKTKCLKNLDQFKRLPWTNQILDRIFEFAKELLTHSPFKKLPLDQSSKQNKNETEESLKNFNEVAQNQNEMEMLRIPAKKNVIILTPPVRAVEATEDLPDESMLE